MTRKTSVTLTVLASIILNSAGVPSVAAGESPSSMEMMRHHGTYTVPLRAQVGESAPEFALDAVVGTEFKKISLADYRGKWVVLFFYPLDFTFVCPTEIRGFNQALDHFSRLNSIVLGVSVDSKYSHLAWIKRGDLGDLKFPLLSDITKETAARYGILDESEGVALRGLFIIDPNGVLQYQLVHNLSVGRSVEETLRVLEALQTGELCPIGWHKGEKTLGK
jgi:alkyl hydroperoxide reductase subunit AhpC